MLFSPSALSRFVPVKPKEASALIISCGYFYLVLCAYYIIRPIRSEMVIANGVDNIQWLMLMTTLVLFMITPIFGWVTSRFRTRQFLSYCTLFFASHLIIFYLLFAVEQRSPTVTRAFFIWVNVFNMFIVSLFWSFMNDVFSQGQSKRLFAFIAAGGTAGAISGPVITTSLIDTLGLAPLLLISATILSGSIICIMWLTRWQNIDFKHPTTNSTQTHSVRNRALKGGVWDGLLLVIKSPYLAGMCLLIALYAISITFVEIQQARLVEQTFDNPSQRTKLFSQIDFAANVLTLVFQLFITSRVIQWIGYRATFMLIPIGITIGFGLMAAVPTLAVMIGVQVFRRAGDYSIMKPTREMLFSVVTREEKYKAKNFIDTAILRTGDTGGAWAYTGIKAMGFATTSFAFISITLGLAWCATAYWLGNQFLKKTTPSNNSSTIQK